MKTLIWIILALISLSSFAQVKKSITVQYGHTRYHDKVIRKSTHPEMKNVVQSPLLRKSFRSLSNLLNSPEFSKKFPGTKYREFNFIVSINVRDTELSHTQSSLEYGIEAEITNKKGEKEIVPLQNMISASHASDKNLFPIIKIKNDLEIEKTTAEKNCELKDQLDALKAQVAKIQEEQKAQEEKLKQEEIKRNSAPREWRCTASNGWDASGVGYSVDSNEAKSIALARCNASTRKKDCEFSGCRR